MFGSLAFSRRRRWLRPNLLAAIAIVGSVYYWLSLHSYSVGSVSHAWSVQQAAPDSTVDSIQVPGASASTPPLHDDTPFTPPAVATTPNALDGLGTGGTVGTIDGTTDPLYEHAGIGSPGSQQQDKISDDAALAAEAADLARAKAAGITLPDADQLALLETMEIMTSGGGTSRVKPAGDVALLDAPKLPRTVKFPVRSLIELPPPGRFVLPKIQADFAEKETSEQAAVRRGRRDYVKGAFLRSWGQYKQFGWGHDEIKPVTQRALDPFLGWAATMVDALDTLLLMGLDAEFRQAVDYIATIDFTRTFRPDIPLFETTIRYLGGLIAAYDLSQGKEKVLLDKAVELADNLLGAFDTPNRMPMTFFQWQDKDTARKLRAGTSTIFAEVGSMSVEFTRLTQLTGNNAYYDAIARITNELYLLSPKLPIPGLFPSGLDLSGCQIIKPITPPDVKVSSPDTKPASHHRQNGAAATESLGQAPLKGGAPASILNGMAGPGSPSSSDGLDAAIQLAAAADAAAAADGLKRRAVIPEPPAVQQAAGLYDNTPVESHTVITNPNKYNLGFGGCVVQGLQMSRGKPQHFALGGLVDSSFEYYMKEFQLLNGGDERYVELYSDMAAAAKKHLVFKPYVENNDNILFAGNAKLMAGDKVMYDNEQTHLGCFAGGMFALAGKLLKRPEDVELGIKLTEGCVWSYGATRTGVMPESFHVRRCPESGPCNFDFNDFYNKDVAPEPGSMAMPREQLVQDDVDGERWPVRSTFDMPRSFMKLDARYILRPEALESVFYMYRITGDRKWQDKGWNMIHSILEATQILDTSGEVIGYSAVNDVTNDSKDNFRNLADSAESFWLAETLKYAYLLFEEPHVASLDDYVYNTEAHPLRRPKA